MKKVLIVYRFLPQYRVDFYNLLREKLATQNITLTLAYGKSSNVNVLKKDEVELPWATQINQKVIKLFGFEFYWQPVLSLARNQDLIIVEQANKLLVNYVLILMRIFNGPKLAFWGHGRNMQVNKNSIRNRFKQLYLKQCDWWFAYTEGVKRELSGLGVPEYIITNVENAIDTRRLNEVYAQVNKTELLKVTAALAIESRNIAIYCGGIYKEKRIDFLVSACDEIRKQVPDFNLLIIGGGEDTEKVELAAKERAWLHYLGPKFNDEKVKYFKISKALLMPGLVGLAVLDSFSMDTPMITTKYPFHSPEIEYLTHDYNGLICEDSMDDYVKSVVRFFTDESLQQRLVHGCSESYKKYTVENMVNHFAGGIKQALKLA